MSWEKEVEELRHRRSLAEAMGGPEGIERQRSRRKLTVRERIDQLAVAVPGLAADHSGSGQLSHHLVQGNAFAVGHRGDRDATDGENDWLRNLSLHRTYHHHRPDLPGPEPGLRRRDTVGRAAPEDALGYHKVKLTMTPATPIAP